MYLDVLLCWPLSAVLWQCVSTLFDHQVGVESVDSEGFTKEEKGVCLPLVMQSEDTKNVGIYGVRVKISFLTGAENPWNLMKSDEILNKSHRSVARYHET